MTTRLVAFAVLIISLGSSPVGQTIHRSDLPHFLAQFPRRHIDRDSITTMPVTRPVQLAAWRLDSIDADGRHILPHNLEPYEWTLLDTTGQSGVIPRYYVSGYQEDSAGNVEYIAGTPQQLGYRYYLMHDVAGYGGGSEVLTVWKEAGDSLRFVCAQLGPFGGYFSIGLVQHLTLLPDMSVLMHIYIYFGDAGDYWRSHSFLRGADSCGFVQFYRTGWDQESKEEVYYEFGRFTNPFYQVIETHGSVVPDNRFLDPGDGDPEHRFSDASAKVINLWDMAKEYFHIDTTKLELRYR